MRPAYLIALLWVAACSFNNPGEEPPRARIYFPTAVTIADDHLLVASSNFDIRYNAGSLQAYDLGVLNEQVDACVADTTADGCDCQPDPRDPSGPRILPCVLPRTADLLASEVLIGSFATAIAYSPDLGRVYVPTRSNGGLTFVNFVDGTLTCGEQGRRCSSAFVAGVDPQDDGLVIPTQPSAVVVGSAAQILPGVAGGYVLVGDQTGALSLFLDPGPGGGDETSPLLHHVRAGLGGEVTDIAVSGNRAYLATGTGDSGDKLIAEIGFSRLDSQAFYASYVAATLRVADVGSVGGVRSLSFVPGSPSRMVAVTLQPSALVDVDVAAPRAAPTEILSRNVIALGTDPSRVQVAALGPDQRPFAFVSCFVSREVMVVDLSVNRLVSVVQGLTGPFSLAIDGARARLYVGDFLSGTVRIVDLAPLVDTAEPDPSIETASPRVLAILGRPLNAQVLQ